MSRTNISAKAQAADACAHRHYGRSRCHVCSGAWIVERRIARLNEAEAMSFADYIDSQS